MARLSSSIYVPSVIFQRIVLGKASVPTCFINGMLSVSIPFTRKEKGTPAPCTLVQRYAYQLKAKFNTLFLTALDVLVRRSGIHTFLL